MDTVPVERVGWIFLMSDGDHFDSLLVVTLPGVLKEPVEPVRWLIWVAASAVMTY